MRSGPGCLEPSGRCLRAEPVVGTRPPPCVQGPGWASNPHRWRASPALRTASDPETLWQGPSGGAALLVGRLGPGPHGSAALPPSSARTGTSRDGTEPWCHCPPWAGSAGSACIAVRATHCRPSPTIPGHGRPDRRSPGPAGPGGLCPAHGCTGGGDPMLRTWARAQRGQGWARTGLHVAALQQGRGQPLGSFRGSGSPTSPRNPWVVGLFRGIREKGLLPGYHVPGKVAPLGWNPSMAVGLE